MADDAWSGSDPEDELDDSSTTSDDEFDDDFTDGSDDFSTDEELERLEREKDVASMKRGDGEVTDEEVRVGVWDGGGS